ncbi:hypothetical protein [Wolbachia endosymbiont (group B) of Longitarsus flavicornis]|uniref:hypothetical protein n=1 Tax=Wolbachia endosymbiont (group B) of Longitarsus flavicornis TaxID=3066135 RepID=UPI00333E41D5
MVNSDSINIKSTVLNNRLVKQYVKPQYDMNTREFDKFPIEISVESINLITDIDIESVKKPLNFAMRPIVNQVVSKVLNGKTKIELPIENILFNGRFLNKLQTSKEDKPSTELNVKSIKVQKQEERSL